MSRAHLNADPFAKISFARWLKVSGLSFAVMLCGFTLLWNSQETMRSQMLELSEDIHARMLELQTATNAQFLELTRKAGRLEGAIDRLDASVAELRVEVRRLGERVDALEH